MTTLLLASSTDTCTAGVMPAPAAVLLGWVVKTSLLAAAGVMLNAAGGGPGQASVGRRQAYSPCPPY